MIARHPLERCDDAADQEASDHEVQTQAEGNCSMTTKITAKCARKLPIPNVPFSNQEFACEATVEVEGQLSPQAIQDKTLELFAYLSGAVDVQFRSAEKR
jgi:hypothetical protein